MVAPDLAQAVIKQGTQLNYLGIGIVLEVLQRCLAKGDDNGNTVECINSRGKGEDVLHVYPEIAQGVEYECLDLYICLFMCGQSGEHIMPAD